MRRRDPLARGFSLVESLVAVAITATALSGFYGALSTGILLGDRADARAAQVLVAATILDRVGPEVNLVPGLAEEGVLDGHRWRLTIGDRPTEDMAFGLVREGELAFVYVTVEPVGGDSASVTLRAIRYLEAPI